MLLLAKGKININPQLERISDLIKYKEVFLVVVPFHLFQFMDVYY